LGTGPAATGQAFLPASAPERVEARTIFDVSSALIPQVVASYGHDGPAFSLAVSPDQSLLAVVGANIVTVHRLSSGEIAAKLIGHTNEVHKVLFVDTNRLVTADDDGKLVFWDLEARTGVIECPPPGAHSRYIYGLDYNKEDGLLIVGDG